MASKLSEKYIAGFFDADGTVGLTFKKDCSKPQIAVGFSQKTSQDKVLHMIQEEHGGNVRINTIGGNDYSMLQIYGSTAVSFLNRIKNHLVIKRHYVNVCLDMVGKSFPDHDAAKKYLKQQRRVKSLPLPNFPPRKWLAGYFDGDGCLSVQQLSGAGTATMVAVIAASDYDTEGIEIISKVYGGFIHDVKGGEVKSWRLSMPASKATEFLGYFAKHLVIKREQAEFVLGCAAMGHFRDGRNIKAALKALKAHDHRLSEQSVDITNYLKTVQDLPPHRQDYSLFTRDTRGKITGKTQAIVETREIA